MVIQKSLEGSRLGIWSAHGEGKFTFPLNENKYQIGAKYSYSSYPSNPNGSNFDTAMLCSFNDGRHLVMMPHFMCLFFQGTGVITQKIEMIELAHGFYLLLMRINGYQIKTLIIYLFLNY